MVFGAGSPEPVCAVNWMESPRRLASFLWAQAKSGMIALFPQLSSYGPGDDSGLKAILSVNTTQAIQLSSQYGYGISGSGMNGAANTYGTLFRSYGDFWNPTNYGAYAEELFQRGASVQHVVDCFEKTLGFDKDFTASSINYATSRAANYIFCTMYRGHVADDGTAYNNNCLDPAIYGTNYYVISWQSPTWVYGIDGHIYDDQLPHPPSECLANDTAHSNSTRLPLQDQVGTPQNSALDYLFNLCITIDKLMGGSREMLIIPEAVAKQFTRQELLRTDALFGIIAYGIKPSFGDSGSVPTDQFTEQDFLSMQNTYHKVITALKDYGNQTGYDFVSNLKGPVDDTRLPADLRKEINWKSFPDPMLEEMVDFADPNSCTTTILNEATSTEPAHCVSQSRFEAAYADHLLGYLRLVGMFSQPQRLAYFERFLGFFFQPSVLQAIPQSALANYHEAQVLFTQALKNLNQDLPSASRIITGSVPAGSSPAFSQQSEPVSTPLTVDPPSTLNYNYVRTYNMNHGLTDDLVKVTTAPLPSPSNYMANMWNGASALGLSGFVGISLRSSASYLQPKIEWAGKKRVAKKSAVRAIQNLMTSTAAPQSARDALVMLEAIGAGREFNLNFHDIELENFSGPQVCAQCGRVNEVGWRFCDACGLKKPMKLLAVS